jgi:toxin-antitoxin system PIN domain toxin
MVIVDGNVLLYAVDSTSPDHERSRAWLDASLAGRETVGLPWVALLAFLRVSTHARLMDDPLTGEEATAQVRSWLGESAALVAEPTPRHLDVVAGLLRSAGRAGPLVMDAHLAALAVEHDATVVSFDRDFARFEGVRHRLPG